MDFFLSLWSLRSGLSFLVFVLLLTLFMMSLGIVVGERSRINADKLVAFECGFDPMSSSRSPFSFRFFLLALLFLVFDVEIILLVSYCYSVKSVFLSIPMISAGLCFIFLLILIFGLIEEANEGALMW